MSVTDKVIPYISTGTGSSLTITPSAGKVGKLIFIQRLMTSGSSKTFTIYVGSADPTNIIYSTGALTHILYGMLGSISGESGFGTHDPVIPTKTSISEPVVFSDTYPLRIASGGNNFAYRVYWVEVG